MDSRSDHTVGYRNPPQHTRFKPGQSGNPKGRPKACLASLSLKQALDELVSVTEPNGRKVRIPKRYVIWKQIVNKAVSGDLASIRFLFSLAPATLEGTNDQPPSTKPGNSEAAQQVFDVLRQYAAEKVQDGARKKELREMEEATAAREKRVVEREKALGIHIEPPM